MTKTRPKLNCATFLKNLKTVNFYDFFSEDVLKTLLRGPKTNRKKYQFVFEKFVNLCSKSRKKINPRFWRNFLKKRTFRFFFANIQKNVQKQIFKRSETIKKNYEVVFKIWVKKKKWTDHPIPSIPSIRQYKKLRGQKTRQTL